MNGYFEERYKIESEIGEGGEGKIYKAHDLAVDRIVAIKELPLHRKNKDEALKEARAIARISHPNVVSLYDVIEEDDRIYLIMEYVEGTTLREILDEVRYLDFQAALGIFIQTALAVEFAHNHGILHLDIKPENILVSPGGKVKLIDFGIARFILESDETERIMGSTHYLAPEALKGRYSIASDVFSLGIVLYEMLAGENPFFSYDREESFRKLIEYDPPPISNIRKDIPEEFDAILAKALAKNPQRRFQDVTRFRIKVERFFAHDYPEEPIRALFEQEKTQRPRTVVKKPLQIARFKEKAFQALSIGVFAYTASAPLTGWTSIEPAPAALLAAVSSLFTPPMGAFLAFAFLAYFWFKSSLILAAASLGLGALVFVVLRDVSKEGSLAGLAFPFIFPGMETAYLTHVYRNRKLAALISGSTFYLAGTLLLAFSATSSNFSFIRYFIGLQGKSFSGQELWLIFAAAPLSGIIITRILNSILKGSLKFFSPAISIFILMLLGIFETNLKSSSNSPCFFCPERLALSFVGALAFSFYLVYRQKSSSSEV